MAYYSCKFIRYIVLLLVFVVIVQRGTKGENQPRPEPDEVETVEITAEPSATSRGALGQGFEIHKEDLLTKQFKAVGAKIFEDLPIDECTANDKLGTIEKDDTFYSSTESLYKSVSTNTKVEGSLKGAYTLGASVEAVTGNINSEETEIQGLSLNLMSFGMSSALKQNCVNTKPLNQELVKDFEALDKAIQRPWKKSSWRRYTAFLRKYRSHIVKESISGSSIYQYVFAESNQKFSQRDFTVKACVSLSGLTQSGNASVSACSGLSSKEVQESTSKSMNQKLVVRGGTYATRAALTGELSPEQIDAFLKEGTTNPSPIQYKFLAIWTILKTRYVGTEHFAKASNLEQFYKGFLHFDCFYDTLTTSQDKVVEVQKFNLARGSDPEAPTYECKLGPVGCHEDNDCYRTTWANCGCGGPEPLKNYNARTCLRYEDKKLKSGTTKQVASSNKERRWSGRGCKWGFWSLSCECESPNRNWGVSWSGEMLDEALRDVNMILLEKKRRDQAKRCHDQ